MFLSLSFPFSFPLKVNNFFLKKTPFPVSKNHPKMEFFNGIREHIKTWSSMHWEAQYFIQSYTEQKWHSAHFQKHCLNSLSQTIFKNLGTKLFDSPRPQHTLLFPNQCFCFWHFTHQKKRSSPSSHLVKWCPFLETQTKDILICFPSVLQSKMIYPFS